MIPLMGDPLSQDHDEIRSYIKQRGVGATIGIINWAEFPYRPIVRFYAGYSTEYLWLHFEVESDYFRVKASEDHEAVWEDSCVEFFISCIGADQESLSTEGDIAYRNFEFNALGICLSAIGTKSVREFLPLEEMNQILRFPALAGKSLPAEGDEFNWELAVAIPLNLVGLKPGSSFEANLYKCGDLTKQPHFLSWNSIESESPDFHLPQFFGEMELVR